MTTDDVLVDNRLSDLIIEQFEDGSDVDCQDQKEGASDYEDLADECEDFFGGDLTKKFTSANMLNYRPNRQTPNVDSTHTAAALRSQTLRSGEAFIQSHMNQNDSGKQKRRNRDRSDRATVEQVLDPRTRLVLFQLIQRGLIESVEGCVSTGKEANVYRGVTESGSLAIKIYKTSILTFKDRDRYVTGEYRYRAGYCRRNPRKMVAVWAEKEVRNLQRMFLAGLPVPKPVHLKGNVLVMEFIGEDGCAAPLLKNADDLSPELVDKLYLDCVTIMRVMYRKCRLVHADLSEYNILLHNQQLVIIDVSQSVEHDHPHSGSAVLGMKRLFEAIVDPLIDDLAFERILQNERMDGLLPDDALFMSAYIPHKLDNIAHYERDYEMEMKGAEVNNPFQKTIAKDLKKPLEENDERLLESEEEEAGDETDSEISFESDGEQSDVLDEGEADKEQQHDKQDKKASHQKYVRLRGESPSARKARKDAVKDDKREKRAVKPGNMDGGVTRSLYIGRDKTSEVLKRREAVEKELQAKREAKIREQNERMARAAQLKEAELRDRTRQKHQRELEKQKALLDRRCAQMEQLNARKTELLKRAHLSASRIGALNQSKKPVFAFGSSTPRELGFLIKHQQRINGPRDSSTSVRGSTPSLTQRPSNTAPTTSRFQIPPLDGQAGSSAMTRSVFGTLGNGIGATPNRQKNFNKPPAQPIKQTPNAIKRQRKAANEVTVEKLLNNSAMTQSLYAQSSSQVTTRAKIEKAPVAMPTPKKRQLLTKGVSKPNTPVNNKKPPVVQPNKGMADQRRPPVIRPKKAQQNQPVSGENGPIEETIINEAEVMVPEQLKQEEIIVLVHNDVETGEQFGVGVLDAKREEEETSIAGTNGDILFDELVGAEAGHCNGGHVENNTHLENNNSLSAESSTLEASAPFFVHPNNSAEVPFYEHLELAEELEERRRRVNEILARTRQAGGAQPNVASNGMANVDDEDLVPSVPQTMTTSASNPQLPQKDASALAQDILAKHRHKFQKQQKEDGMLMNTQNVFSSHQQPTNLANELAESGFRIGSEAGGEMFSIPGQVITAANQFSHETSLAIFSKNAEERDDHILSKQHPSPPDDPLINGHELSGKEFHPPEPTSNKDSLMSDR
uniref:Serine/threonine-protein kinase RIO1 n=1 Tax=Globodera rostochiensis TaxID=31243 RepID=A0A914HR39_GLORO